MAEATVASAAIRVLVPVRDARGSIVTYEWRTVQGTEISLKGVELKNGETLSLTHSVNGLESRDG